MRQAIGTDKEGRFSLPNVPASRSYLIGVAMGDLSKPGLATRLRPVAVGKDGTTTNGVDFMARSAATVSGRVILPDEKPVPRGRA
jgi:hypothetical protein